MEVMKLDGRSLEPAHAFVGLAMAAAFYLARDLRLTKRQAFTIALLTGLVLVLWG